MNVKQYANTLVCLPCVECLFCLNFLLYIPYKIKNHNKFIYLLTTMAHHVYILKVAKCFSTAVYPHPISVAMAPFRRHTLCRNILSLVSPPSQIKIPIYTSVLLNESKALFISTPVM